MVMIARVSTTLPSFFNLNLLPSRNTGYTASWASSWTASRKVVAYRNRHLRSQKCSRRTQECERRWQKRKTVGRISVNSRFTEMKSSVHRNVTVRLQECNRRSQKQNNCLQNVTDGVQKRNRWSQKRDFRWNKLAINSNREG